jgi:hypothetical protein
MQCAPTEKRVVRKHQVSVLVTKNTQILLLVITKQQHACWWQKNTNITIGDDKTTAPMQQQMRHWNDKRKQDSHLFDGRMQDNHLFEHFSDDIPTTEGEFSDDILTAHGDGIFMMIF